MRYAIHQKTEVSGELESKKPPKIIERGGLGSQEHVDNFLECVKSRNQPNAPAKIGHLAVCGPHLANVAYHNKQRAYLNDEVTRVSTRAWMVGRNGG